MLRVLVAALLLNLFWAPIILSDDYSAFRIPRHNLYTVTGSLSGEFFNTRYRDHDYWQTQRRPFSFRLNNLEGQTAASGQWLLDSDSLRVNAIAEFIAGGRHQESRTNIEGDLPRNNGADRNSDAYGDFSFSGDARSYPGSGPAGFFGALAVRISSQAAWGHSDSRGYYGSSVSSSTWDTEQRWRDYDVKLDFGVGLGRVRDVTAVYDIQVLEERLLRAGYLESNLTDATRTRMVSLFYVSGYYSTVHDRADKFLWRDVETLLRDDPGLVKPVDAFALYRIAEGDLQPAYVDTSSSRFFPGEQRDRFNLNRSRLFRQRGFFIGPVVEGTLTAERYYLSDHSVYTYEDDYNPPSSDVWNNGDDTWDAWADVWLGGRAEYHRPFGSRWQLDLTGRALMPQLSDNGPGLDVENELRVSLLITDRWRGDLLMRQSRYLYPDNYYNDWKTTAALGVRYYLEDHLSMTVSAIQLQGRQTQLDQEPRFLYYLGSAPPYVYPSYPEYQRVYRINVGLEYHFLGGLDTFGLVPRQSLVR